MNQSVQYGHLDTRYRHLQGNQRCRGISFLGVRKISHSEPKSRQQEGRDRHGGYWQRSMIEGRPASFLSGCQGRSRSCGQSRRRANSRGQWRKPRDGRKNSCSLFDRKNSCGHSSSQSRQALASLRSGRSTSFALSRPDRDQCLSAAKSSLRFSGCSQSGAAEGRV